MHSINSTEVIEWVKNFSFFCDPQYYNIIISGEVILSAENSEKKSLGLWSWSWSWSWSCRFSVVLWNTILLRSSS